MKITCEKCQSAFKVDEDRIRKEGAKFRCSKCGHTFAVRPTGEAAPSSAPPAGNGADGGKPPISPELLELNKDLHFQMERKTLPAAEGPPVFRIIKDDNCPLYEPGDEFQLSGKIFRVPVNKAPCLILARDVLKLLQTQGETDIDPNPAHNCSGCTGRILFKYKQPIEVEAPKAPDGKPDNYMGAVVSLLSSFSIFKGLREDEIRDIVSFLRLNKFQEDDVILRKGEPGRNLFIVVAGKVEVVSEDGMSIAFMGSGEVFGEMSLLSGDPVGATIKVVEPSTVLFIGAKDFKKILNEIPGLQLNFTRLLARRMAEINLARSEEFASGMTGKLSEMPPAELFQTLNVNQKTGVLTLKLPRESAYLSFREGELINARYRNKDGQEAFFELLKIKEGRFKFIPGLSPEEMEAPEVGDFMHLLMEGLRKIDEDDKNFLRTMIPNLTQ
jgi:CRP/FNR family transcriptional regulator, cyclic AMP receptor protein